MIKILKTCIAPAEDPPFSSNSSAIIKEHTERLRAGRQAHLEIREHPSLTSSTAKSINHYSHLFILKKKASKSNHLKK